MNNNYKGITARVLIILKKDHNIFYPNKAQYNARITTQITNILKLFFSLEMNVRYIDKKYCINIARSINENSNIFLTNSVGIDVASGLITSDLEEYEKESLNDKSESSDNTQEEEKSIYKTDPMASAERYIKHRRDVLFEITKLYFKILSLVVSPITELFEDNNNNKHSFC